MADKEHLKLIRKGVAAWNEWRGTNRVVIPDFSKANFSGKDLRGANLFNAVLYEANLTGANLTGATLKGASLIKTDLTKANLGGADLRWVQMVKTKLLGTTLTGSFVYGASVWDIKVNKRTKQQNLIITDRKRDAPVITVDNIKVAQFIYLLLKNQEIRDVIDAIGQKGVLILGRFTEERKKILDALRLELRNYNLLPIIFDFERPTNRDFTETIKILAGLSLFVIVDLTKPKAVPHELMAAVPDHQRPSRDGGPGTVVSAGFHQAPLPDPGGRILSMAQNS
jgi:uncharacterized protein YjbI with pentapeptide repeats